MLHLPQLTLCAVDTRTPALALRALRRSQLGIRFGRTLLLTDEAGAAALGEKGEMGDVECGRIDTITSTAGYSAFMLGGLADWVQTPQVLVVQWDGFVLDAGRWEPGFLDVDYLGAPWHKAAHGHVVGNGGFSLRSRRLLQALRDPAIKDRLHHPEDICIGQTLRPWLEQQGLVFGSAAQAQRFAFEHAAPPGGSFGFHGLANLPRALGPDGFAELLPLLPDGAVQGRDGFKCARALLQMGQRALAQQLMARRRAAGRADLRLRWLDWRSRWGLHAGG